MNWRAIGIAVAVGVGGSLLVGVLWSTLGIGRHGSTPLWAMMLLSYGTGALIDIATGAVAGALARTRGALHGLVAGTITALLSPLIGITMMLVQARGTMPVPLFDYLLAVAPASVIGIVLAILAGAIASMIAARHVARTRV